MMMFISEKRLMPGEEAEFWEGEGEEEATTELALARSSMREEEEFRVARMKAGDEALGAAREDELSISLKQKQKIR